MTAPTDQPFRFGAPDAGPGGCCNKPAGCTSESKGCVRKPEKKAWHARVAALPRCAQCSGIESATVHIAGFHPDHHPFRKA